MRDDRWLNWPLTQPAAGRRSSRSMTRAPLRWPWPPSLIKRLMQRRCRTISRRLNRIGPAAVRNCAARAPVSVLIMKKQAKETEKKQQRNSKEKEKKGQKRRKKKKKKKKERGNVSVLISPNFNNALQNLPPSIAQACCQLGREQPNCQ